MGAQRRPVFSTQSRHTPFGRRVGRRPRIRMYVYTRDTCNGVRLLMSASASASNAGKRKVTATHSLEPTPHPRDSDRCLAWLQRETRHPEARKRRNDTGKPLPLINHAEPVHGVRRSFPLIVGHPPRHSSVQRVINDGQSARARPPAAHQVRRGRLEPSTQISIPKG